MDEQKLQAKKTIYKGIVFKSKLEAKTAQALDILDIEWEYEPNSFKLPNGMWYRPDFRLPNNGLYIECKGKMGKEDAAKIYGFADSVFPIIVFNYNEAQALFKCEKDGNLDVSVCEEVFLCECNQCHELFFLAATPFRAATNDGFCPMCFAPPNLIDMVRVNGVKDLFDYSQAIAAAKDRRYADFAEAFNRNNEENGNRIYDQSC